MLDSCSSHPLNVLKIYEKKTKFTRMHSSRMHTDRGSSHLTPPPPSRQDTHLRSDTPFDQTSCQTRHPPQTTHPPRQTRYHPFAYENITFPTSLCYAAGNITKTKISSNTRLHEQRSDSRRYGENVSRLNSGACKK